MRTGLMVIWLLSMGITLAAQVYQTQAGTILAYYRFLNLPPDKKLLEALTKVVYKKVFILDRLPLVPDYARTEDEAAQKEIDKLLTEVYESLPFPVVHVPVLPPNDRLDFILKNL
jgi:predicted ATPase